MLRSWNRTPFTAHETLWTAAFTVNGHEVGSFATSLTEPVQCIGPAFDEMQRMSASSPIDVVLQDAPGGIQEGLLARPEWSQTNPLQKGAAGQL